MLINEKFKWLNNLAESVYDNFQKMKMTLRKNLNMI